MEFVEGQVGLLEKPNNEDEQQEKVNEDQLEGNVVDQPTDNSETVNEQSSNEQSVNEGTLPAITDKDIERNTRPAWANALKMKLDNSDLTVRGTLSSICREIAKEFGLTKTKVTAYYTAHFKDKNVDLRAVHTKQAVLNGTSKTLKKNKPQGKKRTVKGTAENVISVVKDSRKTPSDNNLTTTPNDTTANAVGGTNVPVATNVSSHDLEQAMKRMVRYVGHISPKAVERLEKLVGEHGIFDIGFEMASVADSYKETDISLMFVEDLERKLKASESV